MPKVRCEKEHINFTPVHLSTESCGNLRRSKCRRVYGCVHFHEDIHITSALAVIHPRAEEPDAGFRAEAFRSTLSDMGDLFGVEAHGFSQAA